MRSLLGRLLVIVIVALTPGLLVQIQSEIQARQTREQLMLDEAIRLMRDVSQQQQRINEGADQLLTAMGSGAFTIESHPEICRRLLTNILSGSPRYLSAAIVDASGRQICRPSSVDPNLNVSDRDYFQRALRTDAFTVGEYAIGRHTGQPTIHLAKSFKSPDGTTGGVALVALNLDWLAAQLANITPPVGAAVNLRDRNGVLLARFPDAKAAVGQKLPPDQGDTLNGAAIGVATYPNFDGTVSLTAYAPVDVLAQGMRVAAALDVRTTLAQVTSTNQRDTILIICAAAWAIITTALLGARLIRHPFRRLLDVVNRWRAGDLSARTGLANNGNEFGRLAAAFDAMAEAQEARRAALRDSEEAYRATFEQASVGMSQATLDGTLLRANDALCVILGRTRDELLNHNFREFTHPDDRATDDNQIRTILSGEAATAVAEKRYIRKDGSIVWVNRSGSVARDLTGRPSRLITITEDITPRKSAQIALEESETRLQLAREAAGFGIWDRDLATNKAIWSDQQWRLRGLEPQSDSVGLDAWSAGIHPEDRAEVLDTLNAAIADPSRQFNATYRIIRADGATRWLHVKSKVMRDAQGKAVRIVGLTMDVTEARETEAQLRRLTANLETRVLEEVAAREAAQVRAAHAERMQALGQLAGGIAHDFNNVLQMVLSASTLIADEPANEEQVRSLSNLITEAADRGAATTSRLLAVGRHGSLRAEDVDVASMLTSLKALFLHTLGTPIAIEIQTGDGLPNVVADKAELETSLINLATNARDAMPQGGRLVMSADTDAIEAGNRESPDGLGAGTYVRVRISDTGSGMEAATLANVGKPFFTTKKAGAGTGLGVALVRSFVERSRGGMRIESQPGQGTTVTLWLPAADNVHGAAVSCDNPRAGKDAPSPAGPPRPHLLLVDDEPNVRRVMALQLARGGFGLSVAASGSEALAMIDQGLSVDALVTDLSMPGMDGTTLIRAAQERRPGLPAVLMTGYAEDGGVNLAIEGATSGAYSLLRKPVTGPQLVDRLRALLAGRANASR